MKTKKMTMQEVASACMEAGFKGWRVTAIVALVWAESGGDAYAVNINDYDPTARSYLSLDRGLCQWNSFWHHNVTDQMAFTPVTALAVMCEMTAGGFKNLDLWNAHKNGLDTKYLPAANLAAKAAGAY